ncbi:MAG TPA: extracellular solute-binding protein [Dermatophilaceae bacterium]|nr:extracellular solute-binding protein [Dermatophilaceae bacterium]
MKTAGSRFTIAVVAAATVVGMSACSSGSSGSAGAGGAGKTQISLLIDSSDSTVKTADAVIKAFEKANPTITVKTVTRPGGADGDNLVKTKLATGDMQDVFWYNSGSLLQALSPAKNLVDLTGDAVLNDTDPSFLPAVTQAGKVYGAPQGTAMGGGILYNREVYAKLGLQVPKSWAEFEANNDKIKAAGITPVISSFKDTWTSQLMVLGDYYNVAKANPKFADDYTANKVKYASDPAALRGFEKLAEINQKGWQNKGFGSMTFAQGMVYLVAGKGAQYPLLTFPVGTLPKEQANKIGFFGIPGDDASAAGATLWLPGGQYIPKTSKNIDAAKKFIAFVASKPGVDAASSAVPPTGPYLIKGGGLPSDVLPVVKDIQAYIQGGNNAPALEFVSPVKGPSLEQITVAVGSGQTSPKDGAAQYDADVTKQAKQLGLPGW